MRLFCTTWRACWAFPEIENSKNTETHTTVAGSQKRVLFLLMSSPSDLLLRLNQAGKISRAADSLLCHRDAQLPAGGPQVDCDEAFCTAHFRCFGSRDRKYICARKQNETFVISAGFLPARSAGDGMPWSLIVIVKVLYHGRSGNQFCSGVFCRKSLWRLFSQVQPIAKSE